MDTLERYAIENFSEIAHKPDTKFASHDNFDIHSVYSRDTLRSKVFKMVPLKDLRSIHINWPLPLSSHLWRENPNNYLSHLLGHEGTNSLLSHLINQGYATALSSSSSHRVKTFDMMSVKISLTEKGLKEWTKVVEAVYMFINKIKAQGLLEYVYDEGQRMSKIHFDNMAKQQALSFASTLSQRMCDLETDEEMADVIWKPYAFEKYCPEEIGKRLDMLNPQNSFIIMMS